MAREPKDRLDETDRIGVLSGQPVGKGADTGPTVCSCFGVGRNDMRSDSRAGAQDGRGDYRVPESRRQVRGSCVPELKKLLVDTELARLSAA
jgi:assimilatory nitrate reductase catalytic subunit